MTDLTKHRSSFNPWIIGFPFLPARPAPGGSPSCAPRRSSWLAALRCRLRRNEIDRDLAAGADPDSSQCLRRRAAQLTSASSREALAAAYERHLAAATSGPELTVVPVNWSAVRAAAPRIVHIAQRLREDPRVRAQGVARARLLLADGNSALYGEGDDLILMHEVRSALALL
jgi:hypothetical protein